MNPKTPSRFSIAVEPRRHVAGGPQFGKAIYSRQTISQPGYYIIRLRLRHAQSQFRPRPRFL